MSLKRCTFYSRPLSACPLPHVLHQSRVTQKQLTTSGPVQTSHIPGRFRSPRTHVSGGAAGLRLSPQPDGGCSSVPVRLSRPTACPSLDPPLEAGRAAVCGPVTLSVPVLVGLTSVVLGSGSTSEESRGLLLTGASVKQIRGTNNSDYQVD